MATQNVFNQIYDEVRKTGLHYEIKESGGSLIIRISSDSRHQFNQNKEKFKFRTSRTFNGSNNVNWRSPKTFEENSCSRPSFPDIAFFRSTPPPTAPPPTQRTTASSPSTPAAAATAVSASLPPETMTTETYRNPAGDITQPQITSTPVNPFRLTRRQIEFPATPTLLYPSSRPPALNSNISVSPSQASTISTLESSEAVSTTLETSETRIPMTEENKKALIQLMALYTRKGNSHYKC